MKVFGGQTKTDISPGRNVPHFTGGHGNFSIKNKYQFLYIILLLKILQNIVIIFTHFLIIEQQQKIQKNQICGVTPVVTVFIL